MLNVQNITAKLASLPDQALQQYAAMNKNDPYIMSLAVSESNRRKQIRAAQQSQGVQEQPKVVDQALQGMAQPMPEDVGIGQLPAGEMEFAGGGILAFAQGDSIPGPRGPNESFAEYRKRLLELEKQKQKAEKAQEAVAREQERLKRLEERGGPLIPASPFFDRVPLPNKDAEAAASVAPQVRQDPLRAQEAAAGIPDGSVVPPVVSGTPDMPNAGPTAPTAPTAPTGLAQIAPPTAAVAADVGSMDIKGKLEELKPFYKDIDNKPAEDIAKAQGAKEKDFATKAVEAEKKLQTELGEYGVGKEKRLKEREAKLSQDEKSNYGLAFLEAGLAMMGGESPNAFANISKGALQGMGSYKKGLASLAERKEKLFDAYDALDDARRSDKKDRADRMQKAEAGVVAAEGRLSDKLFTLATDKGKADADTARALATASIGAASTEWSAKHRAAQSAADRETNVRLTTAKMASDRAIAEGQQATQKFIAQLPGDMQKLYTTLGNGDPVAGLKLAKEIEATGKKDIMTVYTEWLKANPTLAMDPNKAMAAFFKQYSVMSGKIPKASDKPTGAVRE